MARTICPTWPSRLACCCTACLAAYLAGRAHPRRVRHAGRLAGRWQRAGDDQRNRMVITKGAPEELLDRCADVPATAREALEAEFAAGNRVIAVATREAPGQSLAYPGRRARPAAPRPPGLPRPAQAGRPRGVAAAGRPRHHGQDPHRGQRGRRGEGLRRPRPAAPGSTLTGADMEAARRRSARALLRRRPPSSPGSARAEGPPRPGATAHRRRRRVPRRRRQRRPGPARRRRRHLRGLRHRRRQGRRRRDAAGKGPRRARRRRHRGPPDLRQHHQVRPDGHVEQLREHVQRRRGVAVPDVPADAAVADPAQQPALRHQPAGHPHR